MGTKIFEKLEKYMPPQTTGVFVEIGSDRFEGSTSLLAELAKKHNTKLISVDVTNEAQKRLEQKLDNVDFVIQTGSEWANEFAQSDNKIALVYLDNFDYQYDIKDRYEHKGIQKQIADYAARGIVMNNVACQVEHMKQLLALEKLFYQDTIIMFDDTYLLNDCWVGKCGACVTYLLSKGYEVSEWETDCGMIMKKS